ncbi:MAG: hypothetical protein IPN69_01690 [Acidobacteria bacterium]|nr:hypothetical protein [Acidobacteriota bacterium]
MRLKKHQMIAALIIALFACGLSAAQNAAEEAAISIEKEGRTVSITDATVLEDGRRVLVIEKNETVKLVLPSGVSVESSDLNSVLVINDSILLGKKENTEAVIAAKKAGKEIAIKGVIKLVVRVVEVDFTRQIIAESTFLPYKSVKDNFGKKFAQSYFVVQVDIRNEKLSKQFIVQTLDVIIDPNQCQNGRYLYRDFNESLCTAIFEKYFIFPSTQQGIRRDEVIGMAKADLGRSNRNLGFRALSFTASMGTVLSGFKGLIGTDGLLGINVLGTTVSDAAKALFPDSSAEKLENVKSALPTEDVIIKSKESKTFNIFIPTDQIFYDQSWQDYIKPARDADASAYALKKVLKLLLLSTATGVLVDNDAPKVKVQSDDALGKVADKFEIIRAFPEDVVKRNEKALKILMDLESTLRDPDPKKSQAAEKTLKDIVRELRNDPFFEGYFNAKKKDISTGAGIVKAIDELSRQLFTEDANDKSGRIKKLEETIILRAL